MPIMEPLPVVEKSQANCALLWDWASPYGAAVRQPTVYQETTMAKHGTLPEYMYHRQCIVLDRPATFVTRHALHDWRPWGWVWRQQWRAGWSEGADGNGSVLQGEIGSSASFLLGAWSQFGKVVGFNNWSVTVLRRLSLQDPLWFAVVHLYT